jgi:hypothetical protein
VDINWFVLNVRQIAAPYYFLYVSCNKLRHAAQLLYSFFLNKKKNCSTMLSKVIQLIISLVTLAKLLAWEFNATKCISWTYFVKCVANVRYHHLSINVCLQLVIKIEFVEVFYNWIFMNIFNCRIIYFYYFLRQNES